MRFIGIMLVCVLGQELSPHRLAAQQMSHADSVKRAQERAVMERRRVEDSIRVANQPCREMDALMGRCRRLVDTVFIDTQTEPVRRDTIYVDRATRRPVGRPAPLSVALAGRKDPGTATLFSLILPGGGQLYAGERGRGALMFLGAAAGVGMAVSAHRDCTRPGCPRGAAFAGGLALLAGSELLSLIDAGPAARRYNRKMGIEPPSVGASLEPTRDGLRVGLVISARLR